MPARGVFHGGRFEFLNNERKGYAEALTSGSKDEFLKDLVRRFFKRFPVELGIGEEPTEEHLKSVDDSKPDPEPPMPSKRDVSPEEYELAIKAYEERKRLIVFRTGQIVRWIIYRHEKDLGTTKEPDPEDPITILTCRLTGTSAFKPRKPVASNLWAKANKSAVDGAFAIANKGSSLKSGRVNIAVRQETARALFRGLPDFDQQYWSLKANQEHRRLIQDWEETISRPASTDPEARQKCIDGITAFMQPILDLVFEFTGMPTTFMMGGPEPADGGRLNIISLHSGSIKGPVKMNFGEAEHAGYKENIVPVFSKFLRKCFTLEDCKAAALPTNATPLLAVIDDHSVNYDHAIGGDDDLDDDDIPLAPRNPSSSTRTSIPKAVAAPRHTSSATQAAAPKAVAPPRNSSSAKLPVAPKAVATAKGPVSAPPRKSSSSSRNNEETGRSSRSSDVEKEVDGSGCGPADVAAGVVDDDGDFRLVLSPGAGQLPRRNGGGGAVGNTGTRRSLTPDHEPPSCPPSLPPSPSSPVTALPAAAAPSRPDPGLPSAPTTVSNGQPGLKFGPPRRTRKAVNTPTGSTAAVPPAVAAVDPNSKPTLPDSISRKRGAEETARKGENSKRRRPSNKENKGSNNKRKDLPDKAQPPPSKRIKSLDHGALTAANAISSHSSAESPPTPSPGPSTKSLPTPLPLPKDCQLAITNTLDLVKRMSLGSRWDRLIDLWLRFESSHSFNGSSKLSTTARPSLIGEWVRRARSPTYCPPIDANEFDKEFWAWWAILQPDWRRITPRTAMRMTLGCWDALDKPGTNGWPSVVAALFFWGRAVRQGNLSTSSWKLAVDDATWVLDQLCGQRSA
ncbi:hypothetical protein GALMADRAFT_232569 [Galerina marginata CBS 339.88]|uniref:Uncharacterized protein n=1 Tax=Galerina marginata (strain CBS 339.88) TaxID=685588 RepID=A0A067SEZ7_GALM3|nr:hypothetical protein GALMADRAFT_232569 [Galerina marginata CBS 339.88]